MSFQNSPTSSIKTCIPQTQVGLALHSFPENISWHCITQVPVLLDINIHYKLHCVTTSTLSHYVQLATSNHLPVPTLIKLLFSKEQKIHIFCFPIIESISGPPRPDTIQSGQCLQAGIVMYMI